MNEQAQNFIITQFDKIGRATTDFSRKEREISEKVESLAWDRRVLYHQCKQLVETVNANPDLKDVKGFNRQDVLSAQWFIEDYEKDQNESPIAKLLDWSTMGGKDGESFLSSQVYDLIGKDDARTLRYLIRDVIKMADPKFAGDI